MPYDAVVNKSDINMGRLVTNLNGRADRGWHLVQMLEQHGNTIMVFESHGALDQLLHEQRRTNQLLEWIGSRLPPAPTAGGGTP